LNKLFIYDILEEGNLKKINELVNEDEILDFHCVSISEAEILIIGKSNKKVSLLKENGEKVAE